MLIKKLMAAFREHPPRSIAGLDVAEVYDYKTHEIRSVRDSAPSRPLPDPSGDLMIFHLDQSEVRFAARPSGTEPKIKFYLFARSDVADRRSLPDAKRRTAELMDRMSADIEAYIQAVLAS